MRRKSIGATSQAFHEPMSTGAFLEFLTRLGCRDAGLRIGGYGSSLGNKKLKTPGSQPVRGGFLAPRACGPGLQALGARALGAPAHQGPGAFSPQTSQSTIFRKPPGGSLAKA